MSYNSRGTCRLRSCESESLRRSLTSCQGFWTPGAFKRSKKKTPHLSPASVFHFPLRRRVKNGTTQQPFNMSHLDNSLPCQRACPFHSDSRKKSKNRFRTKETPTCLLPLYFFLKSAHSVVKLKKFFIKPTEATNHTGKKPEI